MSADALVLDTVLVGDKAVIVEKRTLTDGTGVARPLYIALDELVVNDAGGNLVRISPSNPMPTNARDITPPLRPLDGGSRPMVGGDTATIVPDNDGHVMIRLQFYSVPANASDTYIELSFGGMAAGLAYYDTGDADELWTDASLTVTCNGGAGIVRWQPFTFPPPVGG